MRPVLVTCSLVTKVLLTTGHPVRIKGHGTHSRVGKLGGGWSPLDRGISVSLWLLQCPFRPSGCRGPQTCRSVRQQQPQVAGLVKGGQWTAAVTVPRKTPSDVDRLQDISLGTGKASEPMLTTVTSWVAEVALVTKGQLP